MKKPKKALTILGKSAVNVFAVWDHCSQQESFNLLLSEGKLYEMEQVLNNNELVEIIAEQE